MTVILIEEKMEIIKVSSLGIYVSRTEKSLIQVI